MEGHSFDDVGLAATLRDMLEAWRADRGNVDLAARVDEVSARLARLATPAGKLQRWWTEHARTYDPVVAASLLDTLHTQARQSNVSWAVIVSRATPLAAELRAQALGAPDAVARGEWLNLVDRIGLLLAWPDDPRVAVALAHAICAAPLCDLGRRVARSPLHPSAHACTTAVVKRVIEIGDLRALERVAPFVRRIDTAIGQRFAGAITHAPPPRTAAARNLDDAWRAVLAEPFALPPRLVLGDAYLQRGDPRGEVIALQCAPLLAIERARLAGETIDASALFGVGADRIGRVIDANWHRWLGELGLVVARGSKFRGGLLSDVIVGHAATPRWAWQRVVDHHELCAMHRLRPNRGVAPDCFADFILALPRLPHWVHVDRPILDALRARTSSLHLSGVALDLYSSPLHPLVDDLLDVSPAIERLALDFVRQGELAEIRALADSLPRTELRFTVDWEPGRDERAILDELRALPRVHVFSYF